MLKVQNVRNKLVNSVLGFSLIRIYIQGNTI